ncbi:YopX family protein [uncultured Methylophaga sp.]|uniref:YopX family protein n=1 Tax=uncultured Methylophaga sp. TaxID=285271 RepID=UPI0030F54B65
MSREIKFRAWKKSESRMVRWYELTDKPDDLVDALLLVKYEAVMQYTGLKDKAGVEIYEGDIVSYEMADNTSNALVRYDDMAVRFRFVCDPDGFSGYSVHKEDVVKRVTVIGNIYETPEILEASTA